MIKLLCDIKDSTTTTLATRVTEQLSSLRGLQSRASDVQKYLVEVAAGTTRMPVNMLRAVIALHALVTVDNKTTVGKVELEEGEKEKMKKEKEKEKLETKDSEESNTDGKRPSQ
jgi:26S proteasome regulatory subunit N8